MTNHTVCQRSIRSRYGEKHPKCCEPDPLHPQQNKTEPAAADVDCSLLFCFAFHLQDLTATKFQVSADKRFVLLAYNIRPVSCFFFPSKCRVDSRFLPRAAVAAASLSEETARAINYPQVSKTKLFAAAHTPPRV